MGSNNPSSRRVRWLDRLLSLLREHTESLILALLLALFIRSFVVESLVIRSEQMKPNLLPGDLILAFQPPFGLSLPWFGEVFRGRQPQRGELVTFPCPNRSGQCLGRVIALAGDRIEMKRQRLILNGEVCGYQALAAGQPVIQEKCLGHERQLFIDAKWQDESFEPKIIGAEKVWIMNDQRSDRLDSRQFGELDVQKINAKASWIWLSLNWGASSDGLDIRWQRTFLRPD